MPLSNRNLRRIKPRFLVLAGSIAIAVALVALYTFLTGTHSRSVVIDAPVEAVWEYVGDSKNAAKWSVFFEEISPLPGAQDGQAGALRRCFRVTGDREAIWWDEITLETRTKEYRRILAFNAHNFADVKMNQGEYYVFQYFEELQPGQTKLTFGHKQLRPTGILDRLAFLIAGREGARTIQMNLENIKEAIESRHQGRPYQRIHLYIEAGTHILETRPDRG